MIAILFSKLKERLKAEGSESVTNCHGLKLEYLRRKKQDDKKAA